MGHPVTPDRVGVVLVEHLNVVRAGLQLLIASEPGLDIVGECGAARRGFDLIKSLRVRRKIVVLIGLELPGDPDAYWLIRAIREGFPQMIVLVTSAETDGSSVSRALFVGADGFIHKDCDPGRFVDAIHRAAEGQIVLEGLPRGALGKIVEGFDLHRTTALLTTREREVLVVAAQGGTAREIGRRLGVGERTVTTHLNHIYRKLGTSGRMAAVTVAVRSGLIPVPAGLHAFGALEPTGVTLIG